MPGSEMPPAEVDADEGLVRALLAAQHPDLAGLPIFPLTFGWDNVLYRLGDDLLVRLPRRAVAAELMRAEQRWLPELAPRLPVPIPAPVRVGVPGCGFPWPWSVCRFTPGDTALHVRLMGGRLDHAALARSLGEFCAALHQPAPEDAPRSPFRGIPLAQRDDATRRRIAALDGSIDGRAALAHWEAALAVPPWPGPQLWLHGDLHPANIVVDGNGRLATIVDFGDISSGDPACDLAVAWMLLPPDQRAVFRVAAAGSVVGGIEDDTWARARGWALSLGLTILAGSADNPPYRQLGTHTLSAVLADVP